MASLEELNLERIAQENLEDEKIKILTNYCMKDWPKDEFIRHYFKLKDRLIVENNVFVPCNRIFVPFSLKSLALKSLHVGHMGINKTCLRAKQTMYCINIENDIKSFLRQCLVCESLKRSKQKEPLIYHEIPDLPFEKLGLDIFTFRGKDYLVIIDYYTKWIGKLKSLFSVYGIPSVIISDNSPFNSYEIKQFSNHYGIDWRTSSPLYAQRNGMSERAVQTCKKILSKAHELNVDFLDLLLEYRATPLPSLGLSPSELPMGRLEKTKITINKK